MQILFYMHQSVHKLSWVNFLVHINLIRPHRDEKFLNYDISKNQPILTQLARTGSSSIIEFGSAC
jgi:hypothetical protein